jgi:hypothetical protein
MSARVFFVATFLVLLLQVSTPLSGQGTLLRKPASELPVFSSSPQLDLQLGTMFSTGFQGSSMFTHAVAPALNWDISRRFNLQVGTILSSSFMNGNNAFFPFSPHMAGGEAMHAPFSQRSFGATMYAAGAYQVNPRLTLIGSAWMDRHQMPEMTMNPMAMNTNFHGANFGFDYRVTENFSFGAQFNVSSGYNPYNPLNNMGMYGFGVPGSFYSPAPFHKNNRW